MKKRNKYRPVYRKNRTKSFTKKIENAAKKYDEFLESTRAAGKGIKKDYKKIKQIVIPRAKETYQQAYSALKPTRDYLSTTSSNIQRGISAAPIPTPNFKNAQLPKPFKQKDIWDGRPTRGLNSRRLQKLF